MKLEEKSTKIQENGFIKQRYIIRPMPKEARHCSRKSRMTVDETGFRSPKFY
jgi:hypothetical protein